jgi:hypothetical protein
MHANEIGNWKAKLREMELDTLQLLDILVKRERDIEKLAKEKEYIANEMVTMKRLQMHMSDRLDDGLPQVKSDSVNNSNEVEPFRESIAKERTIIRNSDVIPHYAEKIQRSSEIAIRPGLAEKIAKSKESTSNRSNNKEPNIENESEQKYKELKLDQEKVQGFVELNDSEHDPKNAPKNSTDRTKDQKEVASESIKPSKARNGKKDKEKKEEEMKPEAQEFNLKIVPKNEVSVKVELNNSVKKDAKDSDQDKTKDQKVVDGSTIEFKKPRKTRFGKKDDMESAKIQVEYNAYVKEEKPIKK